MNKNLINKLGLGSVLALASMGAFAADIELPAEVTTTITAAGVMLLAALGAIVVMKVGPWAMKQLARLF